MRGGGGLASRSPLSPTILHTQGLNPRSSFFSFSLSRLHVTSNIHVFHPKAKFPLSVIYLVFSSFLCIYNALPIHVSYSYVSIFPNGTDLCYLHIYILFLQFQLITIFSPHHCQRRTAVLAMPSQVSQ